MKVRKRHKVADHSRSSFDSFLEEHGIREEVEAVAIKRVLAWQLSQAMQKQRKTKQAMAQIHDILLLEIAKGVPTKDVLEKKEKYLQNSGLVKNVNDLLKDGWGKELDIKAKGLSDISIHSTSLTNYENKKRKALGKEEITENDEVDETES